MSYAATRLDLFRRQRARSPGATRATRANLDSVGMEHRALHEVLPGARLKELAYSPGLRKWQPGREGRSFPRGRSILAPGLGNPLKAQQSPARDQPNVGGAPCAAVLPLLIPLDLSSLTSPPRPSGQSRHTVPLPHSRGSRGVAAHGAPPTFGAQPGMVCASQGPICSRFPEAGVTGAAGAT